jgi:hypothetical protein
MAKAATRDRFRITCETEAETMGPLIAQLTRMGLTNVSFELVTDIPRYARNAAPDGITAVECARAWLAEHPTFKAHELAKHFAASGRAKGSVYGALTELVEEKVLKQLGNGNYARADVKHIAAPKKPGEGTQARYAVSHGELILLFAAKHPTFRSIDVKNHFEKKGRPPGSVSTALHDLVAQKKLKRIGDGEYSLTAAAARANGNGATEASTEAAHG